jgi:CDP-diacylglycerol---glycerol-3-phosphate 3-phosphatidyltransferase
MLNLFARAHTSRVTDPVGRWLVTRGVPPDAVTVAGTLATCAAAAWFLPRGQLFLGAFLVTVFVLFDMVDGAMARARGYSTAFGAVLDSTCDRVADGVLFAALAWWCLVSGQRALAVAALVCLVAGQVVSYVKARAEGAGLSADGGLVERPERLILSLVGAGFEGLGIPFSLAVGLWLLAAGSLWTLGERFVALHRSSVAAGDAGRTALPRPPLPRSAP